MKGYTIGTSGIWEVSARVPEGTSVETPYTTARVCRCNGVTLFYNDAIIFMQIVFKTILDANN